MTIDIDALRATLAKATEMWTDKWKLAHPNGGGALAIYPDTGKAEFPIAVKFEFTSRPAWKSASEAVVALHNAAPALLAEIESLRAAARDTAGLVEALRAVIDGHGCQPGYLSHSAMQIARAALNAHGAK